MTVILAKGFRKLTHLLGIDRAVGFTVLARTWTILSGALTVLLIARFLTPTEQGYYYTFASLVALQSVFELGFSFVILQLAAHECSGLEIASDGKVTGNEASHSRLASVLQKSVRWYSVAAALMAVTLLAAGFYFFSAHSQTAAHVAWKMPWVCVVLAASFTFQMDPVFSFLEGCGFVPQVARLRFTQSIAGTVLAWSSLTMHHGLFAPAGVIAGQALAGAAFLFSRRRLLLPLLRRKTGENIVSWRGEIWPFQWRIAVSYMSSYLIYPLFSPVVFAYRGAAEAGRMGMSLNIANALAAFAYAWVYTKASPFGSMVARGDFESLDRVFFRALRQSGAILLLVEASVLGALGVIGRYYPRLPARMLPIPVFAILMLAIFLNHMINSEAAYLRAHKREPFFILAVAMGTLTAIGTLLTGRLWGAAGVAVGYFFYGGVCYCAAATLIFIRCRRAWHGVSAEPAIPG